MAQQVVVALYLHVGNVVGGERSRAAATELVQVANDAAIDGQKDNVTVKLAENVQVALAHFQALEALLQAVSVVGAWGGHVNALRVDLPVDDQTGDDALCEFAGADEANLGSGHIAGLLGSFRWHD